MVGHSLGDRWVRPSVPEDGPAIVALMRSVGMHPHADPKHLHWKYWQERADWVGPRSFVLTDGRELLAHVALMPGMLRSADARATVSHPIDWAARRDAVGAGVALMKHAGRLSDYLLAIGGSSHTLKILPLMGYRQCGTVTGYVRPLSPVAILRQPTGARWKLGPRVARSLLWSWSAPRDVNTGWQARRLGLDKVPRINDVLPGRSANMALLERTPALIRHALECPILPVELYAMERAGRIGGYFILSFAPGQARLADLWMDSEDPADWRALAHCAVLEAKRRRELAELVAWSSDPRLVTVLKSCGFHARLRIPIYLRSAPGAVARDGVLRVQMIDNDAYYFCVGRSELWA